MEARREVVTGTDLTLIPLLRLERFFARGGIEALTVGTDVDRGGGIHDVAVGLEEVGKRAIEGEARRRQVDGADAVGEGRGRRLVVVRQFAVFARLEAVDLGRGCLEDELIEAAGEHHLELVRELQEVLQVEAVRIVARRCAGVKIRLHVTHAVRVVDGHFRVQARALDQVGELVASTVAAIGVTEEIDIVVAREVIVLHAAAERDATGSLELLVDGVHSVGESQRVGQLYGVEVDELLLAASHIVMLVDRLIAGGIAELLGAEVVNVVVGVRQSILQLESRREAVVVLHRYVRAVMQHEVRFIIVTPARIESRQAFALGQIRCAVGVEDVVSHELRQTDIRSITVTVEAAADVQLLILPAGTDGGVAREAAVVGVAITLHVLPVEDGAVVERSDESSADVDHGATVVP